MNDKRLTTYRDCMERVKELESGLNRACDAVTAAGLSTGHANTAEELVHELLFQLQEVKDELHKLHEQVKDMRERSDKTDVIVDEMRRILSC